MLHTLLLLLGYFKYTRFFVQNINFVDKHVGLAVFNVPSVHLPLAVSFLTFHAISYLVDIHRSVARAQRDPTKLALYFTFFPHLIAGPIVRYNHIERQLSERTVDVERFVGGAERFILGLAKKVLIANSVAVAADSIFRLPTGKLTAPVAWFGVLCYAIQILYDFSGYSDMAIGMAKMFGFEFPENLPYSASSITDFWRRWHMTLSRWFRDYLYIPLGGNRGSRWQTYLNLLIVFFLCGLWHGAAWSFVAWGLYHGFFLVVERIRNEKSALSTPSSSAPAVLLRHC